MSKDVKPYENPNDRAEVLKREGNELQLKGYYKEAYRRYSEALKFDPQNPVYYANRAASNQALYQYVLFWPGKVSTLVSWFSYHPWS